MNKLANKKDDGLKVAIQESAQLCYGQPAKKLKVKAAFNLEKGKTNFYWPVKDLGSLESLIFSMHSTQNQAMP